MQHVLCMNRLSEKMTPQPYGIPPIVAFPIWFGVLDDSAQVDAHLVHGDLHDYFGGPAEIENISLHGFL